MISFTVGTQRSVYWTSVPWCLVLLAAICCCNGLLHQKTTMMANPLQSASESSTMPDTTKHPETAAVDLGDLLDASDGAVVTLVAGNTRPAAHRAVLAAGSPVLAAMFRPETLEASSREVDIPDIEGPVLRQLLAFLYTGRASQLPRMAPQLLAAADRYGVGSLKDASEQQLLKQLDVESAAAAAVVAVKHSRHSLRKAAIAFIRAHVLKVMATDGWAEAMLNHPREVVQITHLLREPPEEMSATAARDSTPTAATAVATSAAAKNTLASTAATHTAAVGCLCTPPSNASAVSYFRSLPTQERDRRLIRASERGSVDDVRALLAAGAAVRARDTAEPGFTALHWAARKGHVDVARCLLHAGAELEASSSEWQQTPLHYAAANGRKAVVRLLIEASADIDARNKKRSTPLHLAAAFGSAEAAAVLLEAGADREARNKWGETVLQVAKRNNHQEVVRILQ